MRREYAATVCLLSADARGLARHLCEFARTKGLTLDEAARVLEGKTRNGMRPLPETRERAKAAFAELLVLEVATAWFGSFGVERTAENAIYRLAPGWGDIDFDLDVHDPACQDCPHDVLPIAPASTSPTT